MKTAPLIALGAIAIASHAGATTTINNDAATFDAAAGGLVLETFDAATPVVLNGNTPTTAGTVTVEHVGSDGNSFIDDGTGANNIDGTQFLDIFVGPEFVPIFPRESFDITLPYAVTAVGFDLADFFSTGTSFGSDISLDGVVITDTVAQGLAATNGAAAGFLGFVSDTPFTTLTFSSDDGFGEAFGIDNLQYSIPAPGTLAVVGAAGLVGVRRRR